jgi:CspA family cold shock protein
MSLNSSDTTATEHLIGRVKWFNNKVGYGFITITDGNRSGNDIFVHHSAINVVNQQYKYLVQGEYVEFDLIRTDSSHHEWQASNIIGIKGGKLMCETRRDLKIARSNYRTERPDSQDVDIVNSSSVPNPRQRNNRERMNGPRRERNYRQSENKERYSRNGEKKEWTLVTRRNNKSNDKYSK